MSRGFKPQRRFFYSSRAERRLLGLADGEPKNGQGWSGCFTLVLREITIWLLPLLCLIIASLAAYLLVSWFG